MVLEYHYFNPALVEMIAKSKHGSMAKFLKAINKEGSWWHRSKKNGTIKWADIEGLADSLSVHPCEFMTDHQHSDLAPEETAALYTVQHSEIAKRFMHIVALKANNSQVRFSEITGIGTGQVSNITTKRHIPGFMTISKIAAAFPDINCRWLLTGEGSPIGSETENKNLLELIKSKDEIISLLKDQLRNK
jgi:hypothetical protein